MLIGETEIGPGCPCYIVAEIGINHQGDPEIARQLIDVAGRAGCNAVKFQKRCPRDCVPEAQWDQPKETPWGIMPYIEYRERMELRVDELLRLADHARTVHGMDLYCSVWDLQSVDDLQSADTPAIKIPSACLTHTELLKRAAATCKPILLSTGMSTKGQIGEAARVLERHAPGNYLLMHSTSSYPCNPAELNLRCIPDLAAISPNGVGYSGHEVGLQTTLAALVLGACVIERHITLDRSMRGTDHGSSVEPSGFIRLVRDIRVIEGAMGDGVKRVFASEADAMKKLRGSDV